MVQMSKIFNDSKTFVDMKLKQKPETTLQIYKEFMAQHDENPNQNDIRKFVDVSLKKKYISFELYCFELFNFKEICSFSNVNIINDGILLIHCSYNYLFIFV